MSMVSMELLYIRSAGLGLHPTPEAKEPLSLGLLGNKQPKRLAGPSAPSLKLQC